MFFNSVQAQQFDQNYAQWKAKQEAIDAKLAAQQPKLSAVVNSTQPARASMGAKIALNSASVNELMQLNGVGAKKAQAIVEYRQQSGGFKHIEELQNVKGIGPALFEKNKNRLGL